MKNSQVTGDSAPARLMNAMVNFDKPLVAAVHGAAVGSGTTMLTHCDFGYAGESTKFLMPFINFALVPEFGTSYSVPAQIGYIRAAELILLGVPFDVGRAAELGFVTKVVPDDQFAGDGKQDRGEVGGSALLACKRLLKRSTRELVERAMTAENLEVCTLVRSTDAKEAIAAFFEKRPPNFTKTA